MLKRTWKNREKVTGYLYIHYRGDNGMPFYVGIGGEDNFKRAKSKRCRNKHWRNIVNKVGYTIEIVFFDIPFALAKLKEIEFILIYGRQDLKTGILVNMTEGGEGMPGNRVKQGIRNPNASSSDYVGVSNEKGKWIVLVHVDKKPTRRSFPTEIEAAEAYDRINLYYIGEDAKLNFPEKREQYLKEDLEAFYNKFMLTKQQRITLFRGISFSKGKKWFIKFKHEKYNFPKSKTEIEAAKIADKVDFYFNNAQKEDLNFPEDYNNLVSEDLDEFFENCLKKQDPVLLKVCVGLKEVGKVVGKSTAKQYKP